MSKTALAEYESARVQQITQNDARRIRQRVDAAQQNPIRAGVRWPFELIQNAHDAGPRAGDDRVEINFALQNESLIVRHTGKPFSPQELAALLSGGSSKEFDDEETTGRFGTGFLVTHGLSPRVDVEGVISTQEGYEYFQIELVRSGNEASITENIGQANRSLEKATAVLESWTACNPTASFTYHGVDCNVAQTGLERLQQALPYLYATCEKLGRVCIDLPDRSVVFTPNTMTEHALDQFTLQETEVSVSDSAETKELIAVRIGKKDGQSALLAIIEKCNGQNRLKLPDDNFPRLFVKFPIAGTDFLQFNVVLDGQFTPEQERDGIPMNNDSKNLICSALSSFPILVEHAVKSGWCDAHKLAHISVPTQTFGESGSGELEWWKLMIVQVAEATAAKPIISTDRGLLPALSNKYEKAVSFLLPSIDAESPALFDYERIYEIASEITAFDLPNKEVAQDWGDIARQWAETGVPVERLGIRELTDWLKERCAGINELPIKEDPFAWLAQLFLLASDTGDHNVRDMINGLLPDQHSKFRSTTSDFLYSDEGVPTEIKDIAADIKIDLRPKLLHNDMSKRLSSPGYESANKLIHDLLDGEYTEAKAVDEILEALGKYLPDGHTFNDSSDISHLRVSARLVSYLGNQEDTQRIRKCPLLTSNDTIIYLTGSNQQILAPVPSWPSSAQQYDELYTKIRVLSSHYCDDDSLNVALDPLFVNRLAIKAPLYDAVRPEVNDPNLLNAISANGQDIANVTVRNASFGQIAFLSTDLVQRCGRDPKITRLLLDFVLNVAAREDKEWSQFKEVNGFRDREQVQLSLRGSTWPFELKVRSWVPVRLSEESEEEGYAPAPANEANLRELLDPTWLTANPEAVDLLHQVFGFRQITLMLDALDAKVESNLVELLQDHTLVESAVRNRELLKSADENPDVAKLISEASPEEIQKIREKLAEEEREAEVREANRSFGYAVQRALATAIESYGLELKPNDRGQDYEVFPGSLNGDLDDVPFSFEVGSYLLEVKATTTGDVRLTPLQAQTASKHPDRFVLAVIDLRGQEIQQSWDASDVEPFAKIVTDISDNIVEVYEGVDAFTDTDIPVRLRNEQQLRYSISADLWDNGDSIDTWVQSLAALLVPSQ